MEKNTRRLVIYVILEIIIFIILVAIMEFFIAYLPQDIQDTILEFMPKAIVVIFLIVITKIVLIILKPAFEKAFKNHMRSYAEMKMVWQLISNLVWIFIIVLVLLIIIGDFTGFLTFGVVVAALLWVMQKPILNIAGWLEITFRRPFSIGDRIEIDGKKGYVVAVGMFHTTLREFGEWMSGDTFTGRHISIPNSSVFEIPILNYTRDAPYIWDEVKIAITYESDHEKAKNLILESAMEVIAEKMKEYSKEIAQKMDIKDLKSDINEGPIIRTEFSDYCVNFYVIFSCEVGQRRAVRSEITEKILAKIKKEEKVNIAYPHMEIVGIGK